MALEHLTTYVATAQRRLLAQYQRLPKFSAVVGALVGQVQELEDALWAIIAQTSVATAEGVWLDRLGAIVGEARGGASDADYRRFIACRILANASQGLVEDLIGLFTTWAPASSLGVTDMPPAALELRYSTAVTAAVVERLRKLLGATRAGGVGVMFIYQTVADANAFTFSSTSALQASSAQGFGDSTNPSTGGGFVGAVRA